MDSYLRRTRFEAEQTAMAHFRLYGEAVGGDDKKASPGTSRNGQAVTPNEMWSLLGSKVPI